MELQIREMGTKLKGVWQGANQGFKLRLIVGVVLGVSLVTAVVLFTRPSYQTLFANLTPADAGQIGQRLQDMNASYRLGDDGKSILVPSTQVYDLRNRLAMEGLPKGGTVGFEIFDQTKLGVTDFERRMQYVRALRGELSRTISQLEGVQSAQVELALPEERLFTKDLRPPTASVVLETMGQLDASQVRAIVHLVSHSVEGLTPDNITVVDTSGQVLSDLIDPDISLTGLSTSQLQLQRSVEKEIERNVQTMLEQVLGPKMVVTRVKAELNFDQREVTKEFFQPVVDEEGILRSMQELRKTFDGQSAQAQGPGGTPPNIPPTYQTTDGNQGHYEEVETTRNYEVNQTREHLVVAPGSVRHLSVSVLVNSNREGGFTEQELGAVQTAVAHAVGLRPEDRQDQISVVSLPFSGSAPEPIPVSPWTTQHRLIYVALAVAAAVLTAVLLRGRRRRISAVTELPVAEMTAREAAAAQEDPETMERERIRKEVERLARQQPEELAQLLATWMSE